MSNPTDINGVEIELGDLVVSSTVTSYGNMKVGIIAHIGEPAYKYGNHTVTVNYMFERDKYAYELGAPKVLETYNDWKYEEYSKLETWEEKRAYKGEEKTRWVNDMRKVGRTMGVGKQVRQRTCNILIIRKKDGSVPGQLMKVVENHQDLYPSKMVIIPKENNDG